MRINVSNLQIVLRHVQPRVFDEPARQIAVRRQVAEHALAAVSTIGDSVETPCFLEMAQQGEHLDRQFGTSAVDAAMLERIRLEPPT